MVVKLEPLSEPMRNEEEKRQTDLLQVSVPIRSSEPEVHPSAFGVSPLPAALPVPQPAYINATCNPAPPFKQNMKHAVIAYYIHYTREYEREAEPVPSLAKGEIHRMMVQETPASGQQFVHKN